MHRFFFLAWLYPCLSMANPDTVKCLGPEQTKLGLIYLHGMVDHVKKSGPEEFKNHTALAALAEKEKIRIAFPISPWANPTKKWQGKLHWPRSPKGPTAPGMPEVWEVIKQQAQSCLKNTEKKAVLGFSNGAYFVTQMYLDCLDSRLEWHGTIGSGSLGISQTKPKPCGSLKVLSGDKDLSHNDAKSFAKRLKSLGYDAEFISFSAGHHLPENLSTWIQQNLWMKSPKPK
jgi:predicted esterase